jgi:hypothetical protein
MTGKETQPKETESARAHTLLKGLGTFAAATVAGILLLALIGLVPGHQESPLLGKVIAVISLAMFGSAAMGAWLLLKECIGWLWEGFKECLRWLGGANGGIPKSR